MYELKPWKLSFIKPHAERPTTLSFKNHSRFSSKVFDIMTCYGKLTQIYIGTSKAMHEIKMNQTFVMNIPDQTITVRQGINGNFLTCDYEYWSRQA